MRKFEQIIALCHQEFGDRVLYTEIEQKETGATLHVLLDASLEAEYFVFYPSIKDRELKVLKSCSNTLNLFIHANNNAKFYYQGYVQTDSSGKKYSEPIDDEGMEIEVDTVFSLDVHSAEEAVEWLWFIFKYRDGSVAEENRSIRVEEEPASRWFEEPRVYIPGVTDKLVPFNKVIESFNVYDLPDIFDTAYGLKDTSSEDIRKEPAQSEAEIEDKNRQAQEKLDDIAKKFHDLAADSNERPQNGDFIVEIGPWGTPTPYSSSIFQGSNPMQSYFFLLRPTKENSFTALHDFLSSQMEGYLFYKNLRSPEKGMPKTMRFITDLETQRQYVLKKKIALTELQNDLDFFKRITMNPEESLKRIGEARKMIGTIIQELIEA